MMLLKAGQSVEEERKKERKKKELCLHAHFGVFWQVIKTVLIGIFRRGLKVRTLEKEENKILWGQEAGAGKKG